MKKLIALILTLALVLCVVPTLADTEAVKTGLSLSVSVAGSTSAGEKAGSASTVITMAAVTIGDDGVIDDCVIDTIQAKIGFDAAGKLTTDPATTFLSKNELGPDYGMAKASSIGKEWYEQAAGFAAYVTGKTLEDVAGIAVNEKGATLDADLLSTCTLGIGDFQALVLEAAN